MHCNFPQSKSHFFFFNSKDHRSSIFNRLSHIKLYALTQLLVAKISYSINLTCSSILIVSLANVHIRFEHVSCSDLDLRAKTIMTHRLHHSLHQARRERDPRLETLSDWLFLKISPLDIQSFFVFFLILCHDRVSSQQLARQSHRFASQKAWQSASPSMVHGSVLAQLRPSSPRARNLVL